MTRQILVISASPRGGESASRTTAQTLEARLRREFPDAKFVYRDLAEKPLPHLDSSVLKAIASKDEKEVEENREAGRLSDALTEELLVADLLVISTPTWNFGIPSVLKAWIDLVVRPGITFRYAEAGVEGLAVGKRAILVIASGGVFSDGPWKPWDYVEPYLRQVLKFIGIEDVQTVRVEGLNIPTLADTAIPNAEKVVNELVM